MSIKKFSIDLSENHSTECDSCEERDDQLYFTVVNKTNPLKYKTEMCKKYSTIGFCNYGDKCKFAHGAHELIRKPKSEHFRKKKCSKYWQTGLCPYGLRCQFDHSHLQAESVMYLSALKAIQCEPKRNQSSRLMKLLSN